MKDTPQHAIAAYLASLISSYSWMKICFSVDHLHSLNNTLDELKNSLLLHCIDCPTEAFSSRSKSKIQNFISKSIDKYSFQALMDSSSLRERALLLSTSSTLASTIVGEHLPQCLAWQLSISH